MLFREASFENETSRFCFVPLVFAFAASPFKGLTVEVGSPSPTAVDCFNRIVLMVHGCFLAKGSRDPHMCEGSRAYPTLYWLFKRHHRCRPQQGMFTSLVNSASCSTSTSVLFCYSFTARTLICKPLDIRQEVLSYELVRGEGTRMIRLPV